MEKGNIDEMRRYLKSLKDLRGASETKPIENSTRAYDGYLDVLDGRPDQGIACLQQALAEVQIADHAPVNAQYSCGCCSKPAQSLVTTELDWLRPMRRSHRRMPAACLRRKLAVSAQSFSRRSARATRKLRGI